MVRCEKEMRLVLTITLVTSKSYPKGSRMLTIGRVPEKVQGFFRPLHEHFTQPAWHHFWALVLAITLAHGATIGRLAQHLFLLALDLHPPGPPFAKDHPHEPDDQDHDAQASQHEELVLLVPAQPIVPPVVRRPNGGPALTERGPKPSPRASAGCMCAFASCCAGVGA